jgi:proton glutamate symport protein
MIFKIKLHWQILIALVAAVAFGYFLPNLVQYVSWMGVVFLRALNMVVVPLIFSSIISGVASIGGGSNLGRLGAKTISFYIGTSFIAILTGLFFVNILQPGVGANLGAAGDVQSLPQANNSVSDILMRIIPDNVFDAMSKGQILPVIFFAILFGFFITQIQTEKQQLLTRFLTRFLR